MTGEQSGTLAARWIIPVSGPPINGGWIRIEAGRIVQLGSGKIPKGARDLGDVALLPGLVNAHTHLEFSDCTAPIGQPGIPLHQWIGMVIATRGETTAEAKRDAIRAGLAELAASGTRLVGEITTPPCDYPHHEYPELELVTFAEVIGLDPSRVAERFEAAKSHMLADPRGAISPHAPYSMSLATLDACVALAAEANRPLAMHVAESPPERELLVQGGGPFADALRGLGVWTDGLFPWSDDPFGMLIDRLAGAPRALIVHGNDLTDAEIERISKYKNVSVVYCPRTHAFFGYDRHPIDRLLAAGVCVALGTDSRASNPDLNVWREVQFLLRHRTDLSPADVIHLATASGADALGRLDLGRLEAGCHAALGSVPTEAATLENLYEDLAIGDYSPVDCGQEDGGQEN